MRSTSMLAAGILLLLVSSLPAQDVAGRLEGRVLDLEGLPLAGVQMVVTGACLQGLREAKSDERGYFRFFSLPTGTVVVKIHHEAFQDVTVENVAVRLGATTSIGEIRLQQKTLETREIVVTAERPLIDLTSTTTGSSLVLDTIKNLPVARDYRSVMAILPGANQSYYGDEVNVSGATGSENTYFVDGIDVSDPYMRFHNMSLPYNFVKEIEIKTGGYEAEYRSSLGGLVNAVTYSGGNEFSGQVFGFFTNNNFSQSAIHAELEPSKGKYSQYDFGLSLGGPIIRDKLWFYGAFNPTVEREDILIPGLGYYEDELTRNIFAAKLTWQPSPKANFVLTALGDPTRHSSVDIWAFAQALNPDPLLTKHTQGGYNFLANGSYFFNNVFFLESSVSYIDRCDRSDPATKRGSQEISFVDFTGAEGAVISGGNNSQSYGDSRQLTISCKSTLVLGEHTLKGGFEYRDNELNSYSSQKSLSLSTEDDYLLQTVTGSGIVHNRIPSLFVQDSWRIGGRLKLNFGLRWSGEFWVASDGRVTQRITDEYQPRIGIIFEPGRYGASKIFGSYGRFYQEISTLLMTWYELQGAIYRYTIYDHDPRLDPSGGIIAAETSGQIQKEIEGLKGQNYDEFVLGYEQAFGKSYKFRLQGIHRNLRFGIEDCMNYDGEIFCANPGRPPLEEMPKMKRRYYGLELTLMKSGGRSFDFEASYTLSRSYGNYPGLFAQDSGDNRPNVSWQFDIPDQVIQGNGLLPNDRTHVFKFFGSYRLPFGLSAGAFFIWQSGTPLSEIGTSAIFIGLPKYLQRGTVGRTPAVADLNIRIAYQVPNAFGTKIAPRVVLDVFHIGSRRKPVTYDQFHYYGVDELGNQTDPNPLYKHPTSYFPPMSGRLGLEVTF
jgi:hypothetical protein